MNPELLHHDDAVVLLGIAQPAHGSSVRVALAPPHTPRGALVLLTTSPTQRHLKCRHIPIGDGREGSFVLSGAFTDAATIHGGEDAGGFLPLFQHPTVPRWRWRLLEGCKDPDAIATRLMSAVEGRDEAWAAYQKSTLTRLVTAFLVEAAEENLDALVAYLMSEADDPANQCLRALIPRWRRLVSTLPPGYELPVVATLTNGGTVFAFLEGLAPGYEELCAVLVHVLGDRLSARARSDAHMAFRTADAVVLTGFDRAEKKVAVLGQIGGQIDPLAKAGP